ncbi:uncharacterized protein LOC121808929 [Salvia splendens]|uniref:uncharacterized protein LOC121808929 n=1 Tax=Salvia splendens TaxID=180675 RepID=UPI001C262168|nr:uncharacterized protein LOC121808929 [Salvia splendens]
MDFMGPFPSSEGNLYILVAVDYVSKWIEAKATRTCESRKVAKFLESNIFTLTIDALMSKYDVHHRLSTPYHQQSNGQAEVSSREIKEILEKMNVPYGLVFGKMCHLPMGVEHLAFWVIKEMNLNVEFGAEERRLQLQELEELRLDAYDSSMWYKEKIKMWHDKNLRKKELKVGQKMLLFQSRLKLMPGKLRSRWIGPYTIIAIRVNGAIELK